MLENIFRTSRTAWRPSTALVGSKEIGFAVVAMTLTLVAVYARAFMTVGRASLHRVRADLAGAVLVSGFTAYPVADDVLKLLRHELAWLALQRGRARADRTTQGYRRALVASSTCAAGAPRRRGGRGASVLLFGALKQELAPVEDRGVVPVRSSSEARTIDYTAATGGSSTDLRATGTRALLVVSGNPVVSQGISFLGLTDWDERNRKSMDVQRELGPKLFALPGVMAFPILPQSLGQSPRAKPVEVVIVSSSTYEELEKIVDRVVAQAQKNPRLLNLETDSSSTSPRSRCRSIATVRRTPACRWTRSGGRSRRCWGGGRSRASSRRGSSTT
jgi:multidrug efflux pump